jgi:hypothetical protein
MRQIFNSAAAQIVPALPSQAWQSGSFVSYIFLDARGGEPLRSSGGGAYQWLTATLS